MQNKMNTPHSSDVREDEINVMALVTVLWRGRWVIVLFALLFFCFGGYYAYKQAVPLYPSTAVLAMDSEEKNIIDVESILSSGGGDDMAINTEVEVLKSRNLIEKLIKAENLLEDPEFNPSLRETTLIGEYKKLAKDTVIGLIKDAISLVKVGSDANDKPAVDVPDPTLDRAIDIMIGKLRINNVRKSRVFKVTITTTNRYKSARLANSLSELYINDQVTFKQNATEQAGDWLSKKAGDLKLDLELSEQAIKEFNANTKLVGIENLEVKSRKLKVIRERLEKLEQKRIDVLDNINLLLTAQQDKDAKVFASNRSNLELKPYYEELLGTNAGWSAVERRITTAITKFSSNKKIIEQQIEVINLSEKELAKQIDSQSDDLVELQQLRRETEANRLLYESFLGRLKETTIQVGLQQADSRLLSKAVPRGASSPKKKIILIFSLFLGAIFGSMFILIQEMRKNTFMTLDALEEFTARSVMGSIPLINEKKRAGLIKYVKEKPTSVFAEAIRNLRTSVVLSNPEVPPQIILSTSSLPSEGKTTTSIMMALNLASLNKRVLLIEGDIRRRVFKDYFSIPEHHPSFLTVLSGERDLHEAVYSDETLEIDILAGENSTINAADLYSLKSFSDFMEGLRSRYDHIVIDTPPVLLVPDARAIGQHVDAILYNVCWNRTTKAQVKQGLAMFNSVGLEVSGMVLTQVNGKKMQKYGADSQYGYYSSDSPYYG